MPNPTVGRFHVWLVVIVVVLFCVLCVASARTVLPQPDEALYANPGYNLLYNGHSGTTLYELRGYMPMSLGHRTYWQFPLYFFVTPWWFRMVGFGVLQVREFSILFGVIGLASWYSISRMLTRSATAGLLAMTMVSLDFFYVLGASVGRMDMFCCGLGSASMAVYLLLRERSLAQALFWSHVLATLCILTHPVGVLYWLGLVFLILRFDRHSLTVKTVAIGIAPAVLGLIVFGAFVLQDSHAFLEQMRSNLENNSGAFVRPGLSSITLIRRLQLEWQHRYVEPFGLGSGVGAANRLKAVVLLAYATAVLGGLAFRRMRQQRGHVELSVLALIAILYLALISPSKFSFYLPHATSFMAACLGAFLYSLYGVRGSRRWIAVGAAAGIALIQLGGAIYRIRQDPYHRSYLPVVNIVKKNTGPNSVIMAPGEIWMSLQHDRFVINDPALGSLSGLSPGLVVWAPTERLLEERARTSDPARFGHVQHILDSARLIYRDQYYQVYLRQPPAPLSR